jgi:hypothetical protein
MIGDLRAAQRSRRNPISAAIHSLPIHKACSSRGRHRSRIVRVRVVPIHAVEVNVVRVPDIRVVNIYVADVRATSPVAIPRVIDLTETQRKPAHSDTCSEAKPSA